MYHRQLFASGETIREQKDEIARLQAEIERLRAEVAGFKESAAKLHDIAASGAEPIKRRRMLDQMAEESFAVCNPLDAAATAADD